MHDNSIIHQLETRRYMAGSPVGLDSDGILHVNGTAQDDNIVVSHNNGQIVVRLNEMVRRFDDTAVQGVSANGFEGDDNLEMRAALPSTLSGGSGKDTLTGSAAQDRFIPSDSVTDIHVAGTRDIVDFSQLAKL